MKATDVIKRDHEAAKEMFNKYKDATDEERPEIEKHLFTALTNHELMEDAHFYPALKEVAGDDPELERILNEQAKLKMEVLSKGALELLHDDKNRIAKMMDDVLAHATEEEQEIFPKAEELLGEDKLEELGAQMGPDSAFAKAEKAG